MLNANEDAVEYPKSQLKVVLTGVESAIIKVLIYFDIFKYPLKEAEISNFLSVNYTGSLANELVILCEKGLIYRNEDYYFISHENIVERRIKGNTLAQKYLVTAARHSGWLSAIPFIQCICISGSLSKNYMDEKSDIDYFIITKTGRLWIVRGIFTLIIKSMWFFNSRKYFCPNYIISENNLEIRDRNIYTAIEIATLIPLFNNKTYYDFLAANTWVNDYLPNFSVKKDNALSNKNRSLLKLWQHSFFTKTDTFIFKLYQYHYNKKFSTGKWQLKEHELKYDKGEIKNHTMGHRNKILDRYDEHIINYEKTYGVTLG